MPNESHTPHRRVQPFTLATASALEKLTVHEGRQPWQVLSESQPYPHPHPHPTHTHTNTPAQGAGVWRGREGKGARRRRGRKCPGRTLMVTNDPGRKCPRKPNASSGWKCKAINYSARARHRENQRKTARCRKGRASQRPKRGSKGRDTVPHCPSAGKKKLPYDSQAPSRAAAETSKGCRVHSTVKATRSK